MNVNPFNSNERKLHLGEAHLRATIFELYYLKLWAEQLGYTLSEMAIEAENPLRNWTLQHRLKQKQLQERTGWMDAETSELHSAQQFWRHILGGT